MIKMTDIDYSVNNDGENENFDYDEIKQFQYEIGKSSGSNVSFVQVSTEKLMETLRIKKV